MNKSSLKFRPSFREREFTFARLATGFQNLGYASVWLGNFPKIANQIKIKNQSRITYLDISNRDLGGSADLKGFANLKSLNAYNNKFENLDCLNNLPAKDKLQKINFYGNTIKEIDFANLLTQFPNLQYLNVENNPVSAANLQKLSKEQLKNLVGKIRDKKFRVNSYRGTVLQDLLFHLQSAGHSGQAKEIAALIRTTTPTETQPARSLGWVWIVGGVSLVGFTLLVGYWLGWRKKKIDQDDD